MQLELNHKIEFHKVNKKTTIVLYTIEQKSRDTVHYIYIQTIFVHCIVQTGLENRETDGLDCKRPEIENYF